MTIPELIQSEARALTQHSTDCCYLDCSCAFIARRQQTERDLTAFLFRVSEHFRTGYATIAVPDVVRELRGE